MLALLGLILLIFGVFLKLGSTIIAIGVALIMVDFFMNFD